MKYYVICIVAVFVIAIGIPIAKVHFSVESQEFTELEITQMTVSMGGRNGTEDYSSITVYLSDGSTYILPSVRAKYVRHYSVGDKIPVCITTYKDGSIGYSVALGRLDE